ncbi:hypothetical protein TWF696_001417 [Orbilia brochopaga]|uniref:Uncharacterized protein n=1 Tax=Orbilia brochopaga TaxID=3140254 RepID=A0AAV9U9G8_9PEZI
MLSSGTLYRLSQCLEDIQMLRATIIRSPSFSTFHNIALPQLYEVLQREEVQFLFEVGDTDRRCISQRLKFCQEVLELAYWDVDSGGDRRLAGWVERGLGGIVEGRVLVLVAVSGIRDPEDTADYAAWLEGFSSSGAGHDVKRCLRSRIDSRHRSGLTAIGLPNPGNIRALTLLGRSWLLKAQQYLSKISEDGSNSSSSGGSFPFTNTDWTSADEDRDIAEQDRKRQDGVYVDARTCLMPAVEFFGRAVRAMEASGVVGVRGGEIYVLQAEANMSLGNVTVSFEAQPYFRTAVEALREASLIDGFVLPGHLERYLRSFEFVLYDRQ